MSSQDEDKVVLMSTKGYQQLVSGTEDGKNLYWSADINTELPIKMAQSGIGASPPITLCRQFMEICKKQGDKVAMQVEREGKVLKWTWNEYYNDVMCFAKAM